MRVLIVLSVVLAACGSSPGERDPTVRPSTTASTPTPAPSAPAGVLEELRLGMRPGLGAVARPSTPADVERVIAPARCELGGWSEDEPGVLDASCSAALPIGQTRFAFRRFALPGEDPAPGLLTVDVMGPALGDPDLAGWIAARAAALTASYGEPTTDGLERRWQSAERHVLLIEPGPICGGLCVGALWIGGPGHPELRTRGFAQ